MSKEGAVILAVEDDERNAALLRAVLEPAGYRLAFARSLAAARLWLADHHPDLVLLDIGLPDGKLRGAATTSNVPILVASARVLAADHSPNALSEPAREFGVLATIDVKFGGPSSRLDKHPAHDLLLMFSLPDQESGAVEHTACSRENEPIATLKARERRGAPGRM